MTNHTPVTVNSSKQRSIWPVVALLAIPMLTFGIPLCVLLTRLALGG